MAKGCSAAGALRRRPIGVALAFFSCAGVVSAQLPGSDGSGISWQIRIDLLELGRRPS
jgi:hypothetical protein